MARVAYECRRRGTGEVIATFDVPAKQRDLAMRLAQNIADEGKFSCYQLMLVAVGILPDRPEEVAPTPADEVLPDWLTGGSKVEIDDAGHGVA